MNKFDRAFDIIIGHEGGYVNDPRDPGGETKYGISKRAYPKLDIKALTLEDAKEIYRRDYWDKVSGDALPWPMALYVFDCAVNQGPAVAIRLMQEAVRTDADGIIGPKTLAAVGAAGQLGHSKFMALRARRYMATMSFMVYGTGWLRRLFVTVEEGAKNGSAT